MCRQNTRPAAPAGCSPLVAPRQTSRRFARAQAEFHVASPTVSIPRRRLLPPVSALPAWTPRGVPTSVFCHPIPAQLRRFASSRDVAITSIGRRLGPSDGRRGHCPPWRRDQHVVAGMQRGAAEDGAVCGEVGGRMQARPRGTKADPVGQREQGLPPARTTRRGALVGPPR